MNRTGSAATEVVVGFSASGGTPFTAVFDGAIPDASVASVAGEIVLEAGDNFICFATLANITYLFSGALLTLPA